MNLKNDIVFDFFDVQKLSYLGALYHGRHHRSYIVCCQERAHDLGDYDG